ncbi:type 1 glutamine amidotransferase family protein [Sorangium sp. So ce131]|uniref:type 1 glutamine amidotransferase family protein n=1 Tax=Sorangium sp. So ce131 TaxID=3133282 RepID=UPI003F5DC6F0
MSDQRDVHLLVLDTLADWEPGFAIAHINRPAPGVPSPYRARTVGLDSSPVRTVGGVTILPDLSLDELRPADSSLLILPGADVWAEPKTDPALAKAREFVDAGVPVAAICGATLGLARAGLLDDRKHTSNDPSFLETSGYRGGAHYLNEPAVEDRGVITASAMAPLEFARVILARLKVFSPAALEAWYGLYKTREPSCYYALMEALGRGGQA